ncbi:MAG: response regulator transcription factor [Evtepia gabavorous]
MKLLYAEDEETMAEAVVDILTYHNYLVDTVADGAEALAYAQNGDYDGIILDVMMPKMDGLEVLSRLREMGCRTPILLLPAKGAVEDRVAGLDLGADDYLPKPFVMEEFLARVRAMLRRREAFTPEILQYDDVTLHGGTFQLRRNGEAVTLPELEYRLMEVLIRNQGIYLSSEDLLVKVWGYNTEAELGTVWVYLSYLRKRLAKLGSRVKIKGRRGIGYTLEVGQ